MTASDEYDFAAEKHAALRRMNWTNNGLPRGTGLAAVRALLVEWEHDEPGNGMLAVMDLRRVLERGHAPRCQPPDEDDPGTCVCEQSELAARLRAVSDIADEYDGPSSEWTRPMDGRSVIGRIRAALDGER